MIEYLTPDSNKTTHLIFLATPNTPFDRSLRKWGFCLQEVQNRPLLWTIALINAFFAVAAFVILFVGLLRNKTFDISDAIFIVFLGYIAYILARDTARLTYFLITGNIKHAK